MNKTIDMHSHLAWGIDDGIATKKETIEALKQAKEDGIIAICSTPHITPFKTSLNDFTSILYRQKELMDLASTYGIYVYSGAEMLMNVDFLDWLDKGIYQTLNESRYMLIEFHLGQDIHYLSYINEYLEEVLCRNMIPVIAHVERFFPIELDIDILETWLDMGCIFQVNRTSFLGFHGKRIQQNALFLLENQMIHIVATDTHRTNGHRVEKLSDMYDFISKKVGSNNAKLLLYKNPYSILMDEDIVDME